MSATFRWVLENSDKPHRCPECHGTATYDRKSVGRRTKVRCVNGCGVQWRQSRHTPRTGWSTPSRSDPMKMWYGWHRDERRRR